MRRVGQAVADGGAWIGALLIACAFLTDGGIDVLELALVYVIIAVHIGVGYPLGLYQGRFWYGSSRELIRLYIAAASAAAAGCAWLWLVDDTDALIAVAFAGPAMLVIAQVFRLVHWRRRRRPTPVINPSARRLIVFGAGDGAEMALRALLGSETSPFVPVAMLDDDPVRRRLEISGVRVMGGRESIGRVAQETGADAMLIAIPSASGEVLQELTELARYASLEVFALPPVEEIFGSVAAADIRPVSELDLLGRHPVEIDVASIAAFVTGRRVLVTGAGGSIGSELCRQIDRFAAASLTMLDNDDSGLHGVQLSLEGRALLQSDELVLVDVRDRERVLQVFAEKRPEVVFHAAALKHLSLLEQYPEEAWKTNVLGTRNIIDAAVRAGVEHFVNISTDKAADPICVLGWSKRITERQTACAAKATGRHYVSVRFGNVLGSRGSVLEIFEAQVTGGGPLTVTDEEVTRFFMTVPEAVRLTLNAAAIGQGGQVMVLDMGHPVKIADVARRFAAASPRHIEVQFTGLRPGEKLHETLLAANEIDERPHHPQISEVDVPPLDIRDVPETVAIDAEFIKRVACSDSMAFDERR